MKRIYKYLLEIIDRQVVEMPIKADLLSVQFQRGALCVWALVDPGAETELREFAIFGTGHPCDWPGYLYFGTAQTEGGHLVWHVFARESFADRAEAEAAASESAARAAAEAEGLARFEAGRRP